MVSKVKFEDLIVFLLPPIFKENLPSYQHETNPFWERIDQGHGRLVAGRQLTIFGLNNKLEINISLTVSN